MSPGAEPLSTQRQPSASRRWLRLGLLVGAILGLQALGGWVIDHAWFEVWPRHGRMLDAVAVLMAAVYTLTMALPFVPGIEIGLAVMLTFGRSAIVAVYACTQLALLVSFLLGRLVPVAVLVRLTEWLHLHGAADLLRRLEPLAPADRLRFMIARAPRRWVENLVAHRYVALAVLVNTPGNALIGGAGGIGMLAGMSGVVTLPRYALTMALATTPVPLLLWLARGP